MLSPSHPEAESISPALESEVPCDLLWIIRHLPKPGPQKGLTHWSRILLLLLGAPPLGDNALVSLPECKMPIGQLADQQTHRRGWLELSAPGQPEN